ncbi:MAG: hypothetical protein AAGF58_15150 [Pseudomonadota bacterium]
MALTKPCREALADLVHNKLSCLQIVDRDDRREAAILKKCLAELQEEAPKVLSSRRPEAVTHAA